MSKFVINKDYAENALEKRSMFQRDYYILLMYFALTPKNQVPKELKAVRAAIRQARLSDLVIRLSVHTAMQTLKHSWDNFINAWNDRTNQFMPFSIMFRALCLPFSFLGTLIMLPVNAVYGALDWLSLRVSLAYIKSFPDQEPKLRIKRASYVALATSFLTIPLRLPLGLVEAFQEPLHLYDFWVKGGVEARRDYKNGEISAKVYAAKIALHTFKVVCTFGAVLNIVGLTVGPVLRFLSQTAHWLIHTKNLLPNAHLMEIPVNALSDTIVAVEKGLGAVTGVHYSYMSMRTNADKAIELGFESCLTKGAALLPREDGHGPMDFERKSPAPA
jgi:hypothetical protein